MIGGIAVETIYWYTLLIGAALAVLLIIFGDVFDVDGPLVPILIISWLSFISLFGFLVVRLSALSSLFFFLAGCVISSVLVF
ncbi:hypothetical protein KYX90_13705, partial [Enterococcus lactis]|nr:hypothetical protein [Enterococcus lactis]